VTSEEVLFFRDWFDPQCATLSSWFGDMLKHLCGPPVPRLPEISLLTRSSDMIMAKQMIAEAGKNIPSVNFTSFSFSNRCFFCKNRDINIVFICKANKGARMPKISACRLRHVLHQKTRTTLFAKKHLKNQYAFSSKVFLHTFFSNIN